MFQGSIPEGECWTVRYQLSHIPLHEDSSILEEEMSSRSHNLTLFLCCSSKFRSLLCNLIPGRRNLILNIIAGDLLCLTLWYQAAVPKSKVLQQSMQTDSSDTCGLWHSSEQNLPAADRKKSTCMEPLNSFELAYLFKQILNSKEQINLNKKFVTMLFPLSICSDVWFHDTVTSSNLFLKTSLQTNK